jgi:hypothetical protein
MKDSIRSNPLSPSQTARPQTRALFFVSMALAATHICAAQATPPARALAGRWDITITTPAGELPSWIEVSSAAAHPTVTLVGVMDHATPLKTASVHGQEIEFVSPAGDEGFAHDMLFKGALHGDHLEGSVTGPSGTQWQWTGVRAPRLDRKGTPQWGAPIKLFNGVDLTGWTLHEPNRAGTWKVQDGELITTGRGSDLVSTQKFGDFQLHVDFKTAPSTNSGVYLRGRYELQIETDEGSQPAQFHTGGIYGFLAPDPEQPRLANVWQSFDITLIGRRLTVLENGIKIIDNREIPGITGGALDSHEALPGPIYLQGIENGPVAFRNIVIRPALN